MNTPDTHGRHQPARCDRPAYTRLAAAARTAANHYAAGPYLAAGPRPVIPPTLRRHPLYGALGPVRPTWEQR